jgi:hypothetical protein
VIDILLRAQQSLNQLNLSSFDPFSVQSKFKA